MRARRETLTPQAATKDLYEEKYALLAQNYL